MAEKDVRDIIRSEYTKCAQDPVHFFRKYATIQHPTKGKIKFNLYPFQADVLNQFNHNRFNIILKSRQMGLSTLVAGYALYKMLFTNDFNVLVIATRQDVARNLVKKVQLMHDLLPVWLRRKTIENNKLSIKFDNGSEIKAVSSSSSSGRSEALSLLILDEAAFIPGMDQLWASLYPTLSTGGDCIALSTPNGLGGWFHQTWAQAEEGKSENGVEPFYPIKLKWKLHPERDDVWRKQQDELLGSRLASQECDAEFLSSGHTVIESEILKFYLDNHMKDPLEKRGIGGDLWIWKYPDYTKSYIVTADVSRGDGSDYSAFLIFDVESMDQVAEFKGMIPTREYGNLLVAISTEYNNALLAVDNRNVGWDTVQQILDRGYKNIYYSYRDDPYVDENIHIRKNIDLVDKKDMIPGFTITTRNRPVMVSKLETYFREKIPVIHSKRLINELQVFAWINGKPQAREGYNDDLVMTLCMMLYLRDTALKLRSIGIDLTKKALSNTYKTVYVPDKGASNQWSQKVGNKKEKLTWLL